MRGLFFFTRASVQGRATAALRAKRVEDHAEAPFRVAVRKEEDRVGDSGTDERTLFEQDCAFMSRAIGLARGGEGWTNPNPLVGAVVVKDGRIIGEGFHERYGEAHAERKALADCARRACDPAGATMYVTLEPCCHTGKQPPCTEAILEAGIARVVVGSRDPNPLVAGKGNAFLRAAGLRVDEDVLRGECDALNPVFFHYITTKLPFVVAKWAMTLDGKIATRTGDSRWVSNERSRADVHELRHRLAAIMVGKGTVTRDDPSLTARRDVPSNQPVRVVVDSRLSISPESQLVRTAREVPVLVGTALDPDCERAMQLRDFGVEVLSAPDGAGKVDLCALMAALGERGIDSVLVEGGGGLHEAMFRAGLVNQVVVYLAPKIVGGIDAKSPLEGKGVALMAEAYGLGQPSIELFDGDVKLTYEVGGRPCSQG